MGDKNINLKRYNESIDILQKSTDSKGLSINNSNSKNNPKPDISIKNYSSSKRK